MICKYCRTVIDNDCRYCPNCGGPVSIESSKYDSVKSDEEFVSTMPEDDFKTNIDDEISKISSHNEHTEGSENLNNDNYTINDNSTTNQSSSNVSISPKSKTLAIILALFLGWFGVHKFYLGKFADGFLRLALSVFSLSCITTIFVIVDIVNLINNNETDSNGCKVIQ